MIGKTKVSVVIPILCEGKMCDRLTVAGVRFDFISDFPQEHRHTPELQRGKNFPRSLLRCLVSDCHGHSHITNQAANARAVVSQNHK